MGESINPLNLRSVEAFMPTGATDELKSKQINSNQEISTISPSEGKSSPAALLFPQPPSPSSINFQKVESEFDPDALLEAAKLAEIAMDTVPSDVPLDPKNPQISLLQYLSILVNTLSKWEEIQRQIEQQNAVYRMSIASAISTIGQMGVDAEKMQLIADLELLKETNLESMSTGMRVNLGTRPDLMLQLVKFEVIPPLVGGGPVDGSAKKMAEAGTPPYDNAVYAEMAKSVGSGWEELSISELDKVINQLKASMEEPVAGLKASPFVQFLAQTAINGAMKVIKFFTRKESKILQKLENKSEELKNTEAKNEKAPTDPLIPLQGTIVNQLSPYQRILLNAGTDADNDKLSMDTVPQNVIQNTLNKALTFEILSQTSNSLAKKNDASGSAAEIISKFLKAEIADKLVSDLSGISTTTPFERKVMGVMLNSFALLMAVAIQPNTTESKLMNALNKFELSKDLAFFANIAKVMVVDKNDPVELTKNIIFLTKEIEENEESIEDIAMLIAMTREMIKKLLLALTESIPGQTDIGFDEQSVVHIGS